MNSGRLSTAFKDQVWDDVVDVLATHAGLFPPTECTWTLHELMEIVKLVKEMGPPRFNNLFKYERVNHYLKGMVMNKACGIASTTKNYLVLLIYIYITV